MSKRKIKTVESKKRETVHSQPKTYIEHTVGNFFTNSKIKEYLPASAIIVAFSFLLYFQSISYGYVLDDLMVIQENKFTKEGFSGIWDIFTTESFTGYFGEKKELVQGNRYRPLSIVTFAIEHGIMGGQVPWLSHFINILLYACTGLMLLFVLELLFRNFKSNKWWLSIPFLATMIYLAHPIHTEAVANIKGRDEIMSMLFSLGALYATLRYMDNAERKWMIIAMVNYFLGLLSKENAITFLAVIPVTVYYFSNTDWKKLRSVGIWLFITTVIYLILRFNTAGVPNLSEQSKDLMNNPFLGMKPDEKLGSIMYTLLKYLQLMVWPHPLSHDYYPYAIPKISLFRPIPLLSLTVYIGLIIAAFKGVKKKSVYSYSIWFYLLTLTIVSNIVINLGTFMNERFIFMASAGFCIALAYFLVIHLPKLLPSIKWLTIISIFMVITGYTAKTLVRVPVWKDAISLNEAAVAISSSSARANSFMSTALFEKFKLTNDINQKKELINKTEIYAQRAIDIMPDYSNGNLMMLGVVSERYKLDGDINAYIKTIKPVILRRPDIPFIKEFSDYLTDRGHNTELFPFYLEMGNELLKFNDSRRNFSVQYLQYAYNINPSNKTVNQLMGTAYELLGNLNEAARFKAAAQTLQ